jgi:hypothetical protein
MTTRTMSNGSNGNCGLPRCDATCRSNRTPSDASKATDRKPTYIILFGGCDRAAFRLRLAQAHLRDDLWPSHWSHVALLDSPQDEFGKTDLFEVSLQPRLGFESAIESQTAGVQQQDSLVRTTSENLRREVRAVGTRSDDDDRERWSPFPVASSQVLQMKRLSASVANAVSCTWTCCGAGNSLGNGTVPFSFPRGVEQSGCLHIP